MHTARPDAHIICGIGRNDSTPNFVDRNQSNTGPAGDLRVHPDGAAQKTPCTKQSKGEEAMCDNQHNSGQGPIDPATLRKHAEEQARTMEPISLSTLTHEDIQRMLHELRVRQIELEMQNEELRTAQAQIDAERTRYFDLYDHVPVGFCTLSEKGLILKANLTTATLLATTRSELVTQPLIRFIHNDDQDIYDLHRKRLLETGTIQKCDLRLVKPDGGYIWAHLKGTVDQADDGAPLYCVVLNDITQQKHAEEENRRFRTIADNSVYGKAIADLQGHLLYVNRFFADLHGYTPEELIGRHISVFHSQEQMAAADRLIASLMQEGYFPPTTVWHRHQDGTEFPLLMSGILIKDDYGTSQCIATSAIDISAQHQAEMKLQKNEEKHRRLIDNSPDIVYVFSDQHGALFFSPRVEEVLGYSLEHLMANPMLWYDSIHPEDRTIVTDAILQAKGREFQVEYRIRNAQGDWLWFLDRSIERRFEDGEIIIEGLASDITKQKKAEDALRHSNELMQYIIEHTNSAVAVHDRDLRYLYVSNRYLRDFRVQEHNIIGKHHYDVFPDLPKKLREVHRKALAGEVSSSERDRYERADGTVDWMRWDCRPWYDANGSIDGIIVYTEVITERVQAEMALRKSEERFSLAMEASKDGIWDWDVTTGDIYCSPGLTSMLGYDSSDVIEHVDDWQDLIHPEDRQKAYQANLDCVNNLTESFQIEYRMKARDGGWKWISGRGRAVYRDASGRAVRIIGTHQDITESKQAEAQLLERTSLLQNITNHMFDLVAMTDFAGVFTYIGPSHRILGFEPDQLVGTSVFDYIHPDDTAYIAAEFTEFVSYPAPDRTRTVEYRQRCKDGSYLWLETMSKILFDDNGSPSLFFSSRNVTERKRAEEALRESEQIHRALIDGLPDTVMRFDRDGRHLFVSDNVREVVDIEVAQFIGRTHAEMGFPEDLCHFWEESIQQVFDSGAPFETEFTFESKVGTTTSNWRLIPERDAYGAVSSVLSISRDITAQRQAEQEYQTLFREMLDGFALHEIVCDAEGEPVDYRFLAVNPAFERMTGLKAETIIGRTVLEVMPSTEKHWIEIFGKVALSGEPVSFENYAAELGKHFEVRAFRPFVGRFVCICQDITEHKRAEEALQESEEKHRRLFETMVQGVTYQDTEGKIVSANPAAEKLLGLTLEQMRGKTSLDPDWKMILEDGSPVPGAEHPTMLALRTGRRVGPVTRGVFSQAHKDHIWLSITATPLFAPGEATPYQAYATFTDITGQKHAAEALRESEKLLSRTQEIAHTGSWKFDLTTQLLTWSDEVYRIFGCEPQEFAATYEAFLDAIHPDDRAEVNEAYSRSLREASDGYKIEHRIVRLNSGEIRYVYEQCVHERDDAGTIIQSIGMVQDITERKREEEENDRLQEQLIQAQMIAHLGSWDYDADENRLVWSDETYQIFGILPQDFKGSKEAFQATIHPEDRDAVVAAYARSLEDADFIYDIEHRILRKDTGEVRHVHERCTHLRDADGTVVRSCGTVQDITERKRAEEERKKLQAQLIQAQKMESIGLLAGGVAHDFNNMLGVILGYAEMTLEQVPAGHPMYKALHGIQQAAQRSADLTRQLLAFARKQTIAPRRIDLNETVEGMLKMLRRLIGEDIDLIWLPGRNLRPVKMDPTQIDQILANLCVNARDAIKGVGRVTIETSNTVFDAEYCAQHAGFVPGEYVLLAVSDNGCGMDRETIGHLFEPFFTTKEQGQGTGLGLASVYGAVKQNNGLYQRVQRTRPGNDLQDLPATVCWPERRPCRTRSG
jgi:PAS domain S-box-containing protein